VPLWGGDWGEGFVSAGGSGAAPGVEAPVGLPADESVGEAGGSYSGEGMLVVYLVMFAVAGYVFKLWLDDFRANRSMGGGGEKKGALPGALPVPGAAIGVAVAGALVLLGVQTWGEYALGIVGEQSDIAVSFLLMMVSAAFIEEVIFRGYLAVTGKGRAWLWGSVLFFSGVFALLHPFLWDYELAGDAAGWAIWQAEWTLKLDSTKAWFSTAAIFVNSLWFYAVRFWALNPRQSLIPCFAAHLAMNLGVFAVKLAQGHVVALW